MSVVLPHSFCSTLSPHKNEHPPVSPFEGGTRRFNRTPLLKPYKPMATHAKPTTEPFWWALFGAGGVAAALFLPILVAVLFLAVPLGWVAAPDHDALAALVRHPITRVVLYGVVALSMFHWAHRFRFTLYDGLQLKHLEVLVVVLCYGGALVVTLWAAVVLFGQL